MIEESPETFIAKWREFGVSAELFPRTEGSPLIEALVGGVIFQLFERTGPYLARSGAAHLIVHPVTKKMVLHGGEGHEPGIEITGISSFDAKGTVLKVEGQVVVVDAGLPLVVGLLGPHEEAFQVGQWVTFSNRPPAHGFVLATTHGHGVLNRREHPDEAL